MIPSEAAEILREADRRSLLGTHLLVIGTNAVPAYFIEAGGRIMNAPAETNDFDMALYPPNDNEQDNPVWAMLKSVDGTYTVNTERPFQARNAKAYEVELLVAPSKAKTMGKKDQPKPAPLHEQEWLLRGKFVTRVVVVRDATPARMTVPDPRWFALQKLWMSRQEKRNPLKRLKDAKQGMALLRAIKDWMPQFKMDFSFEDEMPDELRPLYNEWKQQYAEPVEPANFPVVKCENSCIRFDTYEFHDSSIDAFPCLSFSCRRPATRRHPVRARAASGYCRSSVRI